METSQWMKCLLHEHEELSSDPQHPYKEARGEVQVCDPSTGSRDEQQAPGQGSAFWLLRLAKKAAQGTQRVNESIW